MMDNKRNLVFLCILLGLFVGILFLIRAQFNIGSVAVSISTSATFPEASSPVVSVALAEFVNVKGEHWRIPKGKQDFEVSSAADLYPQFVSGTLDPLDVLPGQTQKMRVVINDTGALTSVYAEVTHDAGKDTILLKLLSAGVVTRTSQFEHDMFFDEHGILTTREDWLTRHKDTPASLVATAGAQSLRQYVYEGSWQVHDTHKTIYRTVFFAKDEINKSNSLTLAWSDPVCGIATSTSPWQLNSNCSLSGVGGVDGVDGNNLILNPGTSITVSAGGTFGYAPGNSITMMNGATKNIGASIIKLSGGSVVKKYVYYDDVDNDGYPSPTLARSVNSASIWTGHLRMSLAPGADKRNPTTDCYEGNINVHPGQTVFATTSRGDGLYDYDCNTKNEYQYPYALSDRFTTGYILPAATVSTHFMDIYTQPNQGDIPFGPEVININFTGTGYLSYSNPSHNALGCGLMATGSTAFTIGGCTTNKSGSSFDGYCPNNFTPISFTQGCR